MPPTIRATNNAPQPAMGRRGGIIRSHPRSAYLSYPSMMANGTLFSNQCTRRGIGYFFCVLGRFADLRSDHGDGRVRVVRDPLRVFICLSLNSLRIAVRLCDIIADAYAIGYDLPIILSHLIIVEVGLRLV